MWKWNEHFLWLMIIRIRIIDFWWEFHLRESWLFKLRSRSHDQLSHTFLNVENGRGSGGLFTAKNINWKKYRIARELQRRLNFPYFNNWKVCYYKIRVWKWIYAENEVAWSACYSRTIRQHEKNYVLEHLLSDNISTRRMCKHI